MKDIEVNQLAKLLSKLEHGFLPYPIFAQVARLVALPIVEFVPLRRVGKNIEVLLIARDEDDPYWPGLLHTPGTVIRSTDASNHKSNWPAFYRILHDELNDTEVGPPHFVGSIFHQSKRGAEQAQLYWIEVLGDPKIGNFFDTTDLPKELMESQATFIKEAARHFKDNN